VGGKTHTDTHAHQCKCSPRPKRCDCAAFASAAAVQNWFLYAIYVCYINLYIYIYSIFWLSFSSRRYVRVYVLGFGISPLFYFQYIYIFAFFMALRNTRVGFCFCRCICCFCCFWPVGSVGPYETSIQLSPTIGQQTKEITQINTLFHRFTHASADRITCALHLSRARFSLRFHLWQESCLLLCSLGNAKSVDNEMGLEGGLYGEIWKGL